MQLENPSKIQATSSTSLRFSGLQQINDEPFIPFIFYGNKFLRELRYGDFALTATSTSSSSWLQGRNVAKLELHTEVAQHWRRQAKQQ
jgi:hypothetical protein